MFVSIIIAALAAFPIAKAQDVVYTATSCTPRYGYFPVPTGTAGSDALPTWYRFMTTTSLMRVTSEVRETVTATYNATTQMNIVTSTVTFSATTTSTPASVVVPTPANFVPMLASGYANPTPIPRIKRQEEVQALQLLKRQTAPNNTGGFRVKKDGTTSNYDRQYVYRMDCRVYSITNRTETTVVTGLPETVYAAGPTAVMESTSTVSVTSTVTEILPRATEYEACRGNNVVNKVRLFNGSTLLFDRVVYRPAEGFPMNSEVVIPMVSSGTSCCVNCQTTANCAGSFYVPGNKDCHLRLTQPPPAAALPAYSSLPSGVALPTGEALPAGVAFPSGIAYPSGEALPAGVAFPSEVAFPSGIAFPFGAAYPSGAPYPIYANPSDTSGLLRRQASGAPIPILASSYPSGAPYPIFNASYPTAAPSAAFTNSDLLRVGGAFPTAVASSGLVSMPMSTSSPIMDDSATCPRGSLSLYLGVIQGQTDFPEKYALMFSNGHCGYFSLWPFPVRDS